MKTSLASLGSPGLFRFLHARFVVLCVGLIGASHVLGQGQAGGDTPTGLAGSFGGSITTGGGSFDPYERNATRSVTDIVVPGAVIPFTYTRIWNSRKGWRHNWQWELDEIIASDSGGSDSNDLFKGYNVYYPDGRVVKFNKPTQPPHAPLGTPGTYTPGLGIQDRLVIQPDGTHAQLLLPDGTVVNFNGEEATSVVDPHGLIVTFTYAATVGMTIKEPGGRTIIVHPLQYPDNTTVTWQVTASPDQSSPPTQTVTYTMSYNANGYWYEGGGDPDSDSIKTNRGTVRYNDILDPTTGLPIEAHYVYKTVYPPALIPNGPRHDFARLIWASDPMFDGPLQKIKYTYVDNTSAPTGDAYMTAVLEERWAPNYWESGLPQYHDPGVLVSRVEMLPWTWSSAGYSEGFYTRRETRGDGAVRTISYFNPTTVYSYIDTTTSTMRQGVGRGQTLVDHFTDYTNNSNQVERHEYDWGHYFQTPTKVTDPRGNVTSQTLEPLLGHVSGQTHPDNSARSWTYTDPANPFYIATSTDELGHTTTYTRDPNTHRVTRIDYPDSGYETVTYNGFGQILSHRLTSGGTESFGYDEGLPSPRGLKTSHTDACGNVTHYSYFADGPSRDRLQTVVDPRNNSTSFEYNGRGQITRTTHADGSFITNVYNMATGTLTSTTDELGHTTSYTYDEYNRVKTVTDPLGHTTQTSYAPWNGSGSLSHVTPSVYQTTSPMGKLVNFDYDQNFRRTLTRQAPGTPDEASIFSEYDPAGNLTKTIDPLGHATMFGYDNRNRQTTITDALGHVTTTNYDAVGNKKWVKHATGTAAETLVQFTNYDAMNRLTRQVDERGVATTMSYDLAGNLASDYDGNLNLYTYTYDYLNRRKKMIYPDATTEEYSYDAAGNLSSYTNRAGNLESLCYDNRNRLWWFQWDDGYTSQQQTTYDPASRVTRIWNWDATINYTYWNDNLLKTEQVLTGSNYNHTATYTYDMDHNRASLACPSGKLWQYGYNQRNQLTAIGNENWVVLASYQYDKAGNRQQRALWNGVVTEYAPVDALNRSPWTRHMFNGTQLARFDYAFDDLNRMKYEQRGATADGYAYDQAGEVTGFNRDGTLSNGVVTGGATMGLIYDFAGNRSQVTNNGTTTNYSVNNVNEYTAVGSDAVESDVKGNVKTCHIKTYAQTNVVWTYTYDAQNRLRLATGGGTTLEFWYDGKNRQITRRINGDNSQITRSVWDGWNLLEERDVNDAPREYYLHGARIDEVVLRWGGPQGDNWYGYDGRGNVSHLFAYIYNGLITESYSYDLEGKPTITPADVNGNSPADNRFLFQGRDYLKEGGVYDYRNRFYHPGLGRFLQPDPVGLQFEGEKLSARSAAYYWSGKAPEKFTSTELNLYRYCHNDPVNNSDPLGLYEEDVHLHLTEFLARNAGFTAQSAHNIAAANQATDTNKQTSPYSGIEARRDFHFTTVERRNELHDDAFASRSEVRFGQYLHALQDSYSHQRGERDRDGEPYGPRFGHLFAGHAPDKTANRPELADRMTRDTYNELRAFYQFTTGRPAPDNWNKISRELQRFVRIQR